uniref:Myb/SANT-like domain-containing protein n=1 Tax=Fagus sylvatica TaxID=28930 RepID=A0A2N9HEM5_FAGSY
MSKQNETLNPNPKPSQNNSNLRALWTPKQITIFCETCVDEHKWDTLKKDWVAWNKLKGSETGLGWDATKGTITATDEWWERKLTEVPEAVKFREKGLDNADLLDIMFKDTAATGNLAWAPSSGVLPSDLETPEEGLGDASGKKGGTATMLTHQLSRICEVVELRNSASLIEPRSNISDVMEHVCTLDGAEKGSDLYLMTARIFQKREKREMFVVMGEPHLQLKFLKDEAELLGRHYFTT